MSAAPRANGFPIVGTLPHFIHDPLGLFLRAAKKGPVVDLAFPWVKGFLLSDPDDIERVLIGENKRLEKDMFLKGLRRILGDGLLTNEGEFWRKQRRLAQPAFHKDRIRAYAEGMVSSAEAAAGKLRDGEVRDVMPVLTKLTLEIVAEALFGSDIAEDDTRVVGAAVDAVMEYHTNPLSLVPGFHRVPVAINRRVERTVAALDEVIRRIVGERRKRQGNGEERGDLLSMLLAARDEDGAPMKDTQVRDEVTTLILAGHETTANALAWTFYLLSKNPPARASLEAELARVLGGRAPTYADLPNLRFTAHAVTEAMRLFPPVWAVGREVIEPFAVRDVMLPKGAQLFLVEWVVHRDPRFFADPEAYLPERWDDGLAKRLPKYAYFPFGGGPRVCIGNAFAMMEATLLLASFARRFRLDLVGGQVVTPVPSITLRPKKGLTMRVTARHA